MRGNRRIVLILRRHAEAFIIVKTIGENIVAVILIGIRVIVLRNLWIRHTRRGRKRRNLTINLACNLRGALCGQWWRHALGRIGNAIGDPQRLRPRRGRTIAHRVRDFFAQARILIGHKGRLLRHICGAIFATANGAQNGHAVKQSLLRRGFGRCGLRGRKWHLQRIIVIHQ